MFDINDVFLESNQIQAFEHFASKKDGHGEDGVLLSDLQEYWQVNHSRIEEEIRDGHYRPGIIKSYDITNGKGKRRTIVRLNTVDRFITRLLEQQMKTCMEPQFLEHSFAYQEGKGILDAVQCARDFIENGYKVVVEIDLKDYFDNIQIELLLKKVKIYITDHAVLQLLESYLHCVISYEGEIFQKKHGIMQGNSISPILSNIYLHDFDELLEKKHYHWIRFADNIYIYTESQDVATGIYTEACSLLDILRGI